MKLDDADNRILNALVADGRMSVAEIARRVGLSKTPVAARIRQLEDAGIIAGYRAILSPQKLGLAHVTFVEVRLSDTREKILLRFNEAVKAVPEIEECHMIAGGFDYLLKVRSSDIAQYRRVMGEVISALPYVASTSSYVAMETVVETDGAFLG